MPASNAEPTTWVFTKRLGFGRVAQLNGSRLVGMKRQLDLHGNVVASFCPTTEERAHRFATGRTPGGQLPYGYDRARSAQARESAVRADRKSTRLNSSHEWISYA